MFAISSASSRSIRRSYASNFVVISTHGFGNFAYTGGTGMSGVNLMPIVATNNTYIYFHRQDGTTAAWNNSQQRSTNYNQPHIAGVLYQTDS